MSDCILFINDSMIPPIFSPFEYHSNNPCHRRIFCPGPSMIVISLLKEPEYRPARKSAALGSSSQVSRKNHSLQTSRSPSEVTSQPGFKPIFSKNLLQKLLTKRKAKNIQPASLPAPDIPGTSRADSENLPPIKGEENPELYIAPEREEESTPLEFMDPPSEGLPDAAPLLEEFPDNIQQPIMDPEPPQEDESLFDIQMPIIDTELPQKDESLFDIHMPVIDTELPQEDESLFDIQMPVIDTESPRNGEIEKQSRTALSIQEGLRPGNKIEIYYGNHYVGTGTFLSLGTNFLIWTDEEFLQIQMLDDPITIIKL